MATVSEPTFYQFIPDIDPPQVSDRSAAGSLPARAFKRCEAATLASGAGYYFFPPTTFHLRFDGSVVQYSFDTLERPSTMRWWLLDMVSYPLNQAPFDNFEDYFDSMAPTNLKGHSYPFLASTKEPGMVQVWCGLVARMPPGWSLLIQPPANIPTNWIVDQYQGIVDLDEWFGPITTVLRIMKTDEPVLFHKDIPLFQGIPIYRPAFASLKEPVLVPGLGDLTEADWMDYQHAVDREEGTYAREARKRWRDLRRAGTFHTRHS